VAIAEIHEAGVRNFIQDLPNMGSEWVRPVVAGQKPLPGYTAIQAGGVLDSLKGFQIPTRLYAFLEKEMARGALVPSHEAQDWYIRNKDLIEWAYKNVVGTVKRGLIGNPATQTANLVSNNIVVELGLKRNGIASRGLAEEVKRAFGDVRRLRDGQDVPDVAAFRKHSRAFDATQTDSSLVTARGQFGQVNKVNMAGTPLAHVQPRPGQVAGNLFLPNHLVDFQGQAEQAYKLAMFRMLRKRLGDRAAAAQVDKYMFDYADRGPVLEIFDRFGLWPFSTYPTKAFGLLVDTILNHPQELAKYPRLRELAYTGTDPAQMESVPERYRSAFTFPLDDKTAVDFQRFLPFGSGIEAMSRLEGVQSIPGAVAAAMGLGRAGQTPKEAFMNAPLFSRLYGIEAGISPYSEAGHPKPLLAEGQPPDEVAGRQQKERMRNYAPSLGGGRGTQALQDAQQGKTSTDYPYQEPRTKESVLLQHGLGIRTFPAEAETKRQKRLEGTVERRAEVVGDFLDAEVERAEKRIINKHWKEVQKLTPRQAAKQYQETYKYLKFTLSQSGRVVDAKGKVTAEGQERIRNAALRLVALAERADQGE
jgi:hypothetical protein